MSTADDNLLHLDVQGQDWAV